MVTTSFAGATGQDTRVLITDGEARAALAACRGLEAAGYRVTAVAAERPAASHWSKACCEQIAAPDPRVDRAAFAGALGEALGRTNYAVLLPGSDAALLAISEHRSRLGIASAGLPDHEVVRRCLNKLDVIDAAPSVGLEVPETERCDSAYAAASAAERIGYPVLIKPWTSVVPDGRGVRQRPSRLVDDPVELSQAVNDFGMPLLVQRRVVGAVHSLAGVRAGGETLAVAFSRYRRTWPPDAGNVSCSDSLETPTDLLRQVEGLLDQLGWEGIFEVELIRDQSGRFTLIDLNPRIYGSLELAIRAGAPLPSTWCDWLLGKPVKPVEARAGVRYRWEDAEARNLLHLFRAGRIREAASVMRPRAGTAHAYFRLGDPAPLVARAAGMLHLRRSAGRPKDRHAAPSPLRREAEGAVTPSADVAVIGAGPYGLACTAFLRHAGADVAAFGEPMGFWRERMPNGMILRSRRRSSHLADPDGSLSLDEFARGNGMSFSDPVPIEEFIHYGRWYQEQVVPDLDRRRVTAVKPEGDRLSLRLEDGDELTARRVIVAAGLFPFARRPESLNSLPAELVSHSGDHTDFDRFRDRRVLVVGSGQSALESAALLSESGAEVELVARADAIVWLAGDIPGGVLDRVARALPPPTDVGGRASGWFAAAPDVLRRTPTRLRDWVSRRCVVPAGAAWLRPRLSEVAINLDRQVSRIQAGSDGLSITIDDGTRRDVDHLMLATGWQVDVARYPFLGDEIRDSLRRENGYPVLSAGLESSVPGLHFVGAPASASFGPIMRFVVGTWYAAPVIARAATGRRQRVSRLSYRPRRRGRGPSTASAGT